VDEVNIPALIAAAATLLFASLMLAAWIMAELGKIRSDSLMAFRVFAILLAVPIWIQSVISLSINIGGTAWR
jgi:hypothetical protein